MISRSETAASERPGRTMDEFPAARKPQGRAGPHEAYCVGLREQGWDTQGGAYRTGHCPIAQQSFHAAVQSEPLLKEDHDRPGPLPSR